MKQYTSRELTKMAYDNGWKFHRESDGSHTQYKHDNYQYLLSIPYHKGKTLKNGLASTLLKQIKGEWHKGD